MILNKVLTKCITNESHSFDPYDSSHTCMMFIFSRINNAWLSVFNVKQTGKWSELLPGTSCLPAHEINQIFSLLNLLYLFLKKAMKQYGKWKIQEVFFYFTKFFLFARLLYFCFWMPISFSTAKLFFFFTRFPPPQIWNGNLSKNSFNFFLKKNNQKQTWLVRVKLP